MALISQKAAIPRVINEWTAIKLEHLDAYLQGYVTATKKWGERYYIDGFAGCGDCILEESQHPVAGSAWRALRAVPRFSAYFFVEKHGPSAEHLRATIGQAGIANAYVFHGDSNQVITQQVLPMLSRKAPSFAFLDPTGLQLHWETVVALAQHRDMSPYKMELLILYPYDMAINRNLSNPAAQSALNRFFGGIDVWAQELEASRGQGETAGQRRDRFVELYRARLRALGYSFVESFGPLCDGHKPKYYVIFAGDNATGAKIMNQVWSRLRAVPGQLGYQPIPRAKGG